jgi:hypothetical protein
MSRLYRTLAPANRFYGAERLLEPSLARGTADRAL